MAYVRKTEQLLTDIQRQVRKMAEAAVAPYNDNALEIGTAEYTSACELAYKAMYAAAPELRGKLPEAWLDDKKVVRLVIKDSAGAVRLNVRLVAPDYAPFAMPKGCSESYYEPQLTASWADCDDILKNWVADAQKRRDQRTETIEKFNTVERQLAAFMRQHASLNSAIKDMPEIEMYVPQEYITRLNAPSAPRNTPKVSIADEVGIDRDALATIAIAHRITATQ
jgi:hypothetical protein